jgi:hypothetical protein
MNAKTYIIEDYQIINNTGDIINKKRIVYYDSDNKEELREFFNGDPSTIRNGYIPQDHL